MIRIQVPYKNQSHRNYWLYNAHINPLRPARRRTKKLLLCKSYIRVTNVREVSNEKELRRYISPTDKSRNGWQIKYKIVKNIEVMINLITSLLLPIFQQTECLISWILKISNQICTPITQNS